MNHSMARLRSILLSLVFVCLPIIAWLQKNAIYDWIRLRQYQPPAVIMQLSTDTRMTDGSRRLFYVYHPQLQDKASFNTSCNDSEKTIVLGCYILRKGIYLYDVPDARLDGVEQVTAAHEMLHAEYDRMSTKEKNHINDLLRQTYATITDKRIRDTIESYRKEGADTTNELHSILGTEVGTLSSELETHYKQYFTDRKVVVGYSEHYEAAFSERQAQANAYLERLNIIKKQVEQLNAELAATKASISADYTQLERDRGAVADVEAFNARVRAFNGRVGAYNQKVNQDAALIDQFNSLLDKYNATVVEEKQLIKAIDSRPTPASTQ